LGPVVVLFFQDYFLVPVFVFLGLVLSFVYIKKYLKAKKEEVWKLKYFTLTNM
jgi:hypothetical protein